MKENDTSSIITEELIQQLIHDSENVPVEELKNDIKSLINSFDADSDIALILKKAFVLLSNGHLYQAIELIRGTTSEKIIAAKPEFKQKLETVLGVTAPEFITPLQRAKITPWKSFIDLNDFRIQRERIGDIDIEDSLRLLEKYGICLLRLVGQNADEHTLRAYFESVGQVSRVQNHYSGEIKNIKPEPDIKPNSGDSAGDLGFHVDGTQHEDQPALLVFQYIVTADVGGNSRFVDVAKVLLEIPEERREQVLINLSRKDAAKFEKGNMVFSGPIFHFPDDHSLACRIRFDDVITVKEEFSDDFEILKNIILDEKFGIKFKPRPGDIIIFDNWRILHARDAVLGNSQRHHRRVWIDALLDRHQKDYRLGIRPLDLLTEVKMKEQY